MKIVLCRGEDKVLGSNPTHLVKCFRENIKVLIALPEQGL